MDERSGLSQVVYASAAEGFDDEALVDLLRYARARNTEERLSGLLLHVDGSFIQVLEGPTDAVDAAFDRISADPRHSRIVVLTRGPIVERRFGDWAMGFATPTGLGARLAGFSDYLRSGRISNSTDAALGDRVLELIDRFHDGSFRMGAA